jgi:hypothetical protein
MNTSSGMISQLMYQNREKTASEGKIIYLYAKKTLLQPYPSSTWLKHGENYGNFVHVRESFEEQL